MAQTSKRFGLSQVVFGFLSVVGLIDATILTIEHYSRKGLPCTFSGGCERVLTSKYSEIAGLPIALLGIVFYGLVLFLVVFSIANREPIKRLPILLWSGIGFSTSLVLTYLQAFAVRSWCQYCLASALTSTLIFICAIIYWLRTGSTIKKEVEDEA